MKLLSTVRLTNNQKRVLAKIASAATPTVAAENISKDANLIGARNSLMKLGLITFTDAEASMTDKGQQIATQENVIDNGGQLTELGNKLAFTDSKDKPEDSGDQAAQPAGDAGMMGGMGGMGDMGGDLGGPPPGDLGGEEGQLDLGGEPEQGAEGEQPTQPGEEESQEPDARQMKAESFTLLKELLA